MFPGDKQAQEEAKKRGLPTLVENDLIIPIIKGSGGKTIKEVWISGGNGYDVSRAKVSCFHDVQLGFVMTFHKSQGRTMNKVIIVVPKRPREMLCKMLFEIFYVGISRVEVGDDVRLLYSDTDDLSYLCSLECSDYLKAWRKGFVKSKGVWNPEKAKRAYKKIVGRKGNIVLSKATSNNKRSRPSPGRASTTAKRSQLV